MSTEGQLRGGRAASLKSHLARLLGLQLCRSWNVFATRMFYFDLSGSSRHDRDSEYSLIMECPWRIESDGRIVVGSEDYGLRAEGNTDDSWERDMQWGQLQDQKLRDLLGKEENGGIVNTSSHFVVESVEADAAGGFAMHLSGGYILAAFPASTHEMEWMVKRKSGEYLALMNGELQGHLS